MNLMVKREEGPLGLGIADTVRVAVRTPRVLAEMHEYWGTDRGRRSRNMSAVLGDIRAIGRENPKLADISEGLIYGVGGYRTAIGLDHQLMYLKKAELRDVIRAAAKANPDRNGSVGEGLHAVSHSWKRGELPHLISP